MMTTKNQFDFDKFRTEVFETRHLELELKNFGDTKETLIWHYTGLNAIGMAKVEESAVNQAKLEKIAEAANKLAGNDVSALDDILGIGEKKPSLLVKRYVIFEEGSIDPNKPKSRADTAKFADTYPIEFQRITDAIWAATGMGKIAKKKQRESGKKAK